jgi:hypothetical protein
VVRQGNHGTIRWHLSPPLAGVPHGAGLHCPFPPGVQMDKDMHWYDLIPLIFIWGLAFLVYRQIKRSGE